MELLERNVFSRAYLSFCHTGVPMWQLPMISWTLLYSPTPLLGIRPCYWHLVAIGGDLFKLVYLRTAPSDILCWPLKHIRFASGWHASSNRGTTKISQTEAPTNDFRPKLVIWQGFCRKLHENERNWARGGHVCLAHPWIGQWVHRY